MDCVTVDTKNVDTNGLGASAYQDLMDGTELSDCPLPCTTTSIQTKLLSERYEFYNRSILDITFSPLMTVTSTRFLTFDLAKVLSDIGGNFL